MEIISRWPWPTVDNVFSCLDSNKLPLSHIASWAHLSTLGGKGVVGLAGKTHLKLCVENDSCAAAAAAVHTSGRTFFSLSWQKHLQRWKKVIRVSGSKKKKKKSLSHPTVRKVYAICGKLLPYNDVSEEDAVPGSRITARYSRWAGPTATVWDFISFFFSFSFLCHHVARRLSEAARGPWNVSNPKLSLQICSLGSSPRLPCQI